jgi:hypothetical protein
MKRKKTIKDYMSGAINRANIDACEEKIKALAMQDFIAGLRSEDSRESHVGYPARGLEQRYYLPYLLGVRDDCPP